ncbi:MAG: DUF3800 domain-containing protein [Spirochaetales bacterium]|nr:DUF3800 domain-containing protein [Spirochaetales bacterium]
MYLCYVDESGTPEIPGNTSHFVLAGLAIPEWNWRECEDSISRIKKSYGLQESEIHIAWILRPYAEQKQIANFDTLSVKERIARINSIRTAKLLSLQRSRNKKAYKQTKKNFDKTAPYIHLTWTERNRLADDLVDCISKWDFARLFAECIDKIYFDPARHEYTISETSFDQIVSRFEQYLQIVDNTNQPNCCGILIYDNNQTVAKKHTELMKYFYSKGTLWTRIFKIIETPLFVDSQLTSMVQIADVCAYSLRRYLENGETRLFNKVFQRADRKEGVVVGIRHFTDSHCKCQICINHRK